MSNTKNKIQYRERNSNNKNACFLSFMYYFNFDTSAEFIQKAQYTCKSSNKYPSTRENQFFFSCVCMHIEQETLKTNQMHYPLWWRKAAIFLPRLIFSRVI